MCTTIYTAHLYEQAGMLARIDRALTFLDARTGETTEVEPDMIPFLSVGYALPTSAATRIAPQFRGNHEHLTTYLGR